MDDTSAPSQPTQHCVLQSEVFRGGRSANPATNLLGKATECRSMSGDAVSTRYGWPWLTSSSTLWQVLYLILLGVREREMRKKKRNKRFFPTMAFLFVLSLFCATLVTDID